VNHRQVRRLGLAAVLVALVALSRGLDAGLVVALSLAVMEIDACT
jgi:hypothetical protein